MNSKKLLPCIVVGIYPLLVWIALLIPGIGEKIGGMDARTFLTIALWTIWLVASMFLSHRVMGSAWRAVFYLLAGIVTTFVLQFIFIFLSRVTTVMIWVFSALSR